MKSIGLKAIAIAVLATLTLDILLSVSMVSLVLGPDVAFDADASDIDALMSNRTFLLWSLVLGTFSTVVGGFIAARFAAGLPYYHALVFGIVGLVFNLLTSDGLPVWYKMTGYLVLIPAALTGAYLAKRSLR
jgi:hypothetical protein